MLHTRLMAKSLPVGGGVLSEVPSTYQRLRLFHLKSSLDTSEFFLLCLSFLSCKRILILQTDLNSDPEGRRCDGLERAHDRLIATPSSRG